jgi:Mg2+ and Co2+ transporter CorA
MPETLDLHHLTVEGIHFLERSIWYETWWLTNARPQPWTNSRACSPHSATLPFWVSVSHPRAKSNLELSGAFSFKPQTTHSSSAQDIHFFALSKYPKWLQEQYVHRFAVRWDE